MRRSVEEFGDDAVKRSYERKVARSESCTLSLPLQGQKEPEMQRLAFSSFVEGRRPRKPAHEVVVVVVDVDSMRGRKLKGGQAIKEE